MPAVTVANTLALPRVAAPAEAVGGSRLFKELIRKKLFDAQLASTAMGATSGLFCWPPDR